MVGTQAGDQQVSLLSCVHHAGFTDTEHHEPAHTLLCNAANVRAELTPGLVLQTPALLNKIEAL